MGQWLRLPVPNAEGMDSIPGLRNLRSHMPLSVAKKKNPKIKIKIDSLVCMCVCVCVCVKFSSCCKRENTGPQLCDVFFKLLILQGRF